MSIKGIVTLLVYSPGKGYLFTRLIIRVNNHTLTDLVKLLEKLWLISNAN